MRGRGSVETDHGRLPVPAPATAAILSKYHLITRGGRRRRTAHPTGAAILAFFTRISDVFLAGNDPRARGVRRWSRDYLHANVLRATLGQVNEDLLLDDIQVLETNVDDVTGEVLGSLIEGSSKFVRSTWQYNLRRGKKAELVTIIQVIARPR